MAIYDTVKTKHKNYEILNLIGYGLAKFDKDFIKHFGFHTKTSFYQHVVDVGIAETISIVKNRQDLLDPFFENNRKGWWQKGEAYIHRKIHIDSLFGHVDANDFAQVVKLYLQREVKDTSDVDILISPLIKTKFKQLQITGKEAEIFFMNNFNKCDSFHDGVLEDARMFGDGYDFQIRVKQRFFLAEVKGVRKEQGQIRMTEKEFNKAMKYNDCALVVVTNLGELPRMNIVFNPAENIDFIRTVTNSEQVTYHTKSLNWR